MYTVIIFIMAMSLHVYGNTFFPPIVTPHDFSNEIVQKSMKQEQNNIGKLERTRLISMTPPLNKDRHTTQRHNIIKTTKEMKRARRKKNRSGIVKRNDLQNSKNIVRANKEMKIARKKKGRSGISKRNDFQNRNNIVRTTKEMKRARRKKNRSGIVKRNDLQNSKNILRANKEMKIARKKKSRSGISKRSDFQNRNNIVRTTKEMKRARRKKNKSKKSKRNDFQKINNRITDKAIKRAGIKKNRIQKSQVHSQKKPSAKGIKRARKRTNTIPMTPPGNADYFTKRRTRNRDQLRQPKKPSIQRRAKIKVPMTPDVPSAEKKGDPSPTESWMKQYTTRGTFPSRQTISFLAQCNVTRDYCTLGYETGAVCGRTLYNHYNTFDSYCILDYVNCMERFDLWQAIHMGPCLNIGPFSEYVHYPYQDDYFMDRDFVIEDM